MMFKYRLGNLLPLITSITIAMVPVSTGLAQSLSTPTPISDPESLFTEDTCSPPCWFGLIPGTSTAEDVSILIEQADEFFQWTVNPNSVFDPATGYVVNGYYHLDWNNTLFERDDIVYASNGISIHNGVVDFISAQLNRVVSLEQAIERLGQPDHVRLYFGPYGRPFLDLIYLQPPLRVGFATGPLATHPHQIYQQENCNVAEIPQSFWADAVGYYSPATAMEMVYVAGQEEAQPALLAFSLFLKEREVPLETWAEWLNGEVDMTCAEARRNLPPTPGETEN